MPIVMAGPVPPFAVSHIGAVAIVWLMVLAIGRYAFPDRLGALGLDGFAATFADTGYIGIPLFITAFGDKGTLPAVVASVVNGAVVTGAAIAIGEVDRGSARGLARAARDAFAAVARNSLVIAPLAGLAQAQADMTLPVPIANFAEACAKVYEGEFGHMLKGIVGLDAEGLSVAEWTLLEEMSVDQLRHRIVMRNAQFSYPLAETRLNDLMAGKARPLAFDYEKAALAA